MHGSTEQPQTNCSAFGCWQSREEIVYKKLYHFVSPILSDNQSGFRRKDGTAHQLTRLVHEWSQALDKDQYVGTVFFDLKKAFDKVWHKGLIKLEFAGINHRALSWFRNYLSDQYQCVKINNSTSTPVRIHAGVPQGAILSPLLFIIYMNDIASLSVQDQASFTNLFADHASLYVANGDPTMLATELQQAVDNLSEWFDNWLLNVNIEKTALLILRKKGMPAIHITVRICGDVIHQVNKHKHLGLILNSTLTWKDHVDYVCSKAAQRIGLLHRIQKRLSALAIRSVY